MLALRADGTVAHAGPRPRRRLSLEAQSAGDRAAKREECVNAFLGDPRQGPADRAAHAAVGAGDGAVRGDDLRPLPLRPRPHALERQPRRRGPPRDGALRRDPRRQPALRRRARAGRLRRDPARAGRPAALYAAKVAILVIYLVCLEAIALPVFAIFFGGAAACPRSPRSCCCSTSGSPRSARWSRRSGSTRGRAT